MPQRVGARDPVGQIRSKAILKRSTALHAPQMRAHHVASNGQQPRPRLDRHLIHPPPDNQKNLVNQVIDQIPIGATTHISRDQPVLSPEKSLEPLRTFPLPCSIGHIGSIADNAQNVTPGRKLPAVMGEPVTALPLTFKMTSLTLASMELVTRLFGEAWEQRRRRLRVTGIAAVIAVAATVGVFAVFGGDNGGGSGLISSQAASFYDSHKTASVLLSRYSDLLSHRVSPRTLPANFADRMLYSAGPRLGLDASDIGEAQPVPGTKVWLIPGISGDCFVERDGPHGGSGQCGPIGGGEFGPGWFGSGPERETASGLVPDGVHRITVHLAGGIKLSVPVKDNAYVIRLRTGQEMTSLSATLPSGRVITERISI